MSRQLRIDTKSWPLREPFAISRGVQTHCDVVIVELESGGFRGRGEGAGVPYANETPETMAAQLESVRPQVEGGCNREELLSLLPAGGARNALDAALWDLEAKETGISPAALAGFAQIRPVETMITIGIRAPSAYEAKARELAGFSWIKVKVGPDNPLEAIAAVRRGAPHAKLLVDPNQAWSISELVAYGPELVALGVEILEQPVSAKDDEGLAGLDYPICLCADEAANSADDLHRLVGRYQMINIKLDKAGGLTNGLIFAEAARAAGMRLMVGCMVGGSVAMAPAMVLAQHCEIADLDGPLLQAEDWPNAIAYQGGMMSWPEPELWG